MKLTYKTKQHVLEVLVKLFKEDIHYYMEGERVIFTAQFHIERGQCCGNGCRHCPFEPKYKHGNQNVQDKYLVTKEEIDIFKSKKGYGKSRKKNNNEGD
jgi:2-iminoacetate synthase ThiH